MYCITCKKCYQQYVGQPKRRLMDRLQGHFNTVSKGTEQLGTHLNLPDHEGTKDMSIQVLAFIKQPSNSYNAQKARDKTELSWIHRLWTLAPSA